MIYESIVDSLADVQSERVRNTALYQLSQQPAFSLLIEEITNVAKEYKMDAPVRDEDKAKWETFCMVRFSVEAVINRIGERITEGARLTQQEAAGETPHDSEEGHNGDRPRRA